MRSHGRTRWRGVELRHLSALQALAEETSFRGAARRLGYSQPAVSQQLATLERIVGRRLVNRPGPSRPLSLTPAGERLLTHARAIHAQLSRAEAELAATSSGGRLRVGTYQTIAAHLLPEILRRFARAEPTVEVSVIDSSGDEPLVALLEDGELDLAFVDLPLLPPRELETERLAEDKYVLVSAANTPLARADSPLSVEELRGRKLIAFKGSGSTQRLIAHLRECGVDPDFEIRSDDISVIRGFVSAGFGAALVPQMAAELLGEDVTTRELDPSLPPRIIGLAWSRDLTSTPAAEAFVAATRDVVARKLRGQALRRAGGLRAVRHTSA